MNRKLFIFSCCCVTIGYGQLSNTNVTNTVRKRIKTSSVSLLRKSDFDSAHFYYLRAWDAYKKNDFGAARYYWERGANCKTNSSSRYSSAFRLGLMNQNGEGIGVNYDIAIYYYKLAYAKGQKIGNNEATKIIAAYYENGLGVMPDWYKALDWYQKAKEQGNIYCNEDIARMKLKIKELEKNYYSSK
jgi:TPR repeat protein